MCVAFPFAKHFPMFSCAAPSKLAQHMLAASFTDEETEAQRDKDMGTV